MPPMLDDLPPAQHVNRLVDDQEYPEEPAAMQHAEISAAIEQVAQTMKLPSNPQKESADLRTSSCEPSFSTNADHNSDAASAHSMPTVQVTEPTSPIAPTPRSPMTPSAQSGLSVPPSPSSLQAPSSPSTLSHPERRARHRSALEIRSSNRLSGFFSNLIHRRDSPGNAATRSPLREESASAASSDQASKSEQERPSRPLTPPPSLPAPTLQELGLSLSAITSELCPPHFSAPPSSGAYLAPHYLLLCHAQGLDVLPLVSPPAPRSYTLVRRVNFKSVVVMEQRGVLVAIAGRRDGVRVYALEEIRRAVEWRMEVEIRREKDRIRREAYKKTPAGSLDSSEYRTQAEKLRKSSLPSPSEIHNLTRRGTYAGSPLPPSPPPPLPHPPQLIPQRDMTSSRVHIPHPLGSPPSYDSVMNGPSSPGYPHPQGSEVNDVLGVASSSRQSLFTSGQQSSSKADWVESSDEEAIDILAAGPSGSQALDERTSSQPPPPDGSTPLSALQITPGNVSRPSVGARRTRRPSNLDLSLVTPGTPSPEPSPAPTLLSLRQALSQPPTTGVSETAETHDPPLVEGDDDDDDGDGAISLAQALIESRLPDVPPLGTQRPQQPILITASHPIATGEDDLVTPRTSGSHTPLPPQPPPQRPQTVGRPQRRRRWSVMIGSAVGATPTAPTNATPSASQPNERSQTRVHRSQSVRSAEPHSSHTSLPSPPPASATPTLVDSSSSMTSRSSRFLPRIFSSAFTNRRSEERFSSSVKTDEPKRTNMQQSTAQAPPPKLDYVKLPGTKGALIVKAVETPRKSFLAILCGEQGEKVELFAGTYKTALGLSRTFILPDSPRSLELQLQGDDLVEVFLVFSQNVFGLEPATVRVREVRIGRAERRAARRRAREHRVGDSQANDSEAAGNEEETNVNVSIGVSVPVATGATGAERDGDQSEIVTSSTPQEQSDSVNDPTPSPPLSEELVTVATAQMGPHTTFQQLSFAPKFPLASIADDYVVPPTYRDFMSYRAEHEPDNSIPEGAQDLSRVQFTPPGLPIPTSAPPSRWYYRDPKNTIHGPWKASLMQAWYKDGLLPPDLPVRREEDSDYILLRDLRARSVDPSQPFTSPQPPPSSASPAENPKPLLPPLSLLTQSRHFGPPALFFSSRGGHSTAIVDARGRPVLKGRFLWSDDDSKTFYGRMGDVKRVEAFDVKDRSVIVAMRQGGLEVMDFGDALLKPADESRTLFPYFNPTVSSTSRRGPFVWKIGMPITSTSDLDPPSPMRPSTAKSWSSGPLPLRKPGLGPSRSPGHRSEFSMTDMIFDNRDEVLFLGRKDDEIYFCERNAGSFRILRLSPQVL